jgi:phosphoglycerate dehydrogenase-like enzyme
MSDTPGADRRRSPRAGVPGAHGRRVNVLVVNDPKVAPLFHVSPEQFRAAFRRAPAALDRIRPTFILGADGFEDAVRQARVLVAYQFPHRGLAPRAPRLQWIHQIGAGIDHLLPLDWLPHGVTLTNSSGVHAPRAGDFVACALLMLSNLIPRHVTSQRLHRWDQAFSDPIAGKTLLIVGVGIMGGEGARRAKQLGLRVLGVRRSRRAHRYVDRMYRPDQLDEALPQADFVLVTAPLTAETRGLIGRRQLDRLKPTAGLINMARAGVVDYDVLMDKLNHDQLAGAVLDVFDSEPLPESSPLWECRNLVMTPHVSSDALNYTERMLRIFADNFQRFLSGRVLRNLVSPTGQY